MILGYTYILLPGSFTACLKQCQLIYVIQF